MCMMYYILFRKVTTESATGSTTSNRVRTTLTIQVENIFFDTQACVLQLKGDLKKKKKQFLIIRNFEILHDFFLRLVY